MSDTVSWSRTIVVRLRPGQNVRIEKMGDGDLIWHILDEQWIPEFGDARLIITFEVTR